MFLAFYQTHTEAHFHLILGHNNINAFAGTHQDYYEQVSETYKKDNIEIETPKLLKTTIITIIQ